MNFSIRRIAEALEKQCAQNERIIVLWGKNLEQSERLRAISERHLKMAEERHRLEMLPTKLDDISSMCAEITKSLNEFKGKSDAPPEGKND